MLESCSILHRLCVRAYHSGHKIIFQTFLLFIQNSERIKSNKKKTKFFKFREKIKLVELVERRKDIIENKKTDNVSAKDKDVCWKNITIQFNSGCISGYRDMACLKNCWNNLKKKTRKYYAEIRNKVFKTGMYTSLYFIKYKLN